MTATETPVTAVSRAFGRCPECRERCVIDLDTHTQDGTIARNADGQIVGCPVHTWLAMRFRPIKVTVVPSITCDAKCHNAVSEVCKCSCGGTNHGQLPARH